MDDIYYNFNLNAAGSFWSRAAFWRQWRALAGDDPRWTPPYYPALNQLLRSRQDGRCFALEAMCRRSVGLHMQPGALTPTSISITAEPVAVSALSPLVDRPQAAHLGLFHCANNEEVLNRFLEMVAEENSSQQLYGPAGISPYLQAGVLGNHWQDQPPLHTPSSPPFLYDLMDKVMKLEGSSRLYWAQVPAEPIPARSAEAARLKPLIPASLAADLYPLMAAAFQDSPAGTPNREETGLLLAYLAHFPSLGWLALVGENPAGFIFLQPDLASRLRRAGGGRFRWWQAWFRRMRDRPVEKGRLLFGSVLPQYRGRGIGRQLWQAALRTGRELGWQAISIGPVGDNQPGTRFLTTQGAVPRQQYSWFSWETTPGGGMWW